jgi:hypothetical protein
VARDGGGAAAPADRNVVEVELLYLGRPGPSCCCCCRALVLENDRTEALAGVAALPHGQHLVCARKKFRIAPEIVDNLISYASEVKRTVHWEVALQVMSNRRTATVKYALQFHAPIVATESQCQKNEPNDVFATAKPRWQSIFRTSSQESRATRRAQSTQSPEYKSSFCS